MPKTDVVRRIDSLEGRGRRRELMGDLHQRFLVRPPGPQPDDIPPAVPTGLDNDKNRLWPGDMKVDVHFVWDDNDEADFNGYPIRWKLGGMDDWHYGPTCTSSSYWLRDVSFRISGSLCVSAVDTWDNQSAYTLPEEFLSSNPPYWEDPTPLDAPSVTVDFTSRNAVFTVICTTASQADAIHTVVYDIFE